MSSEFDEISLFIEQKLKYANNNFDIMKECEPYFQDMVSRDLFKQPLHDLLLNCLMGSQEVSPDISFGKHIVVRTMGYSTWAIIQHSIKPDHIYMVPNHSLSALISDGEIRVTKYSVCDPITINDVKSDTKIYQKEQNFPAKNQVFTRNGFTEADEIVSMGVQPALTFRVNTSIFGEYEWAFDQNSCSALQVYTLRERESFLTTIFDLLGDVRSPESIPFVEPFSAHPLHFVRWKAIQTLGRIDKPRALAFVEAALEDPHPQIRAAAEATLSGL